MDKSSLQPWILHFRHFFSQIEEPPSKVKLRAGQGINLLLHVTPRQYIALVLSTRDGQTHVRQAYQDTLKPREQAWLDALEAHVRTLDADPSWRAVVAWSEDQPGISIVRRDANEDAIVTSGDEEVIRLLEPCNAACSFCACIGVMPDYSTSKDDVAARLDRALARGRRRIVYTGGEPTLLKHLPELVKLAKDKGVQWVNLQTNGIRLSDPARVKALAAAGLDSVLVSIHSHRPEVHNAVMKVPGALENALKGLVLCIKAGIQVNLNCVVHRENLHDVPAYLAFFHKHFVRKAPTGRGHFTITLSFVSPIGWTLENLDLIPRISDAAPVLAKALRLAEHLDLDVHVPGLCGLPACTMPGYEQHLDELKSDTPPSIPARTYVAACDSCSWRPKCSGYWSVYIDQHGDGEFGQHVARPWARKRAATMRRPSEQVLAAIRGFAAIPLPDTEMATRLNDGGLLRPSASPWTAEAVKACREAFDIPVEMPASARRDAAPPEA
jgi:MoaA/NifB/PqqE/SkfB family radical SAM enzyme